MYKCNRGINKFWSDCDYFIYSQKPERAWIGIHEYFIQTLFKTKFQYDGPFKEGGGIVHTIYSP